MTLLGKVLTVLILVMSIVFMAFAVVVYATHTNWRDKVTGPNGLDAQVQSWRDKNQQLQVELERAKGTLAREQAARRFVIASLRTKLEDAEAALRDRVKEFEDLQGAHADLTQANQTASMTLARLQTEVGDLRSQLMNAIDDRTVEFNEVVRLTDAMNSLQGVRDVLESRNNQLVAQNTRFKGHLDSLGVRAEDPIPDEPTKPLFGMVTDVSDGNLIEISLGSDDGIRENHQLYVYRGDTYLGRVIIRSTSADFALGEIVKEYNKSVLIRKGDSVATKLI